MPTEAERLARLETQADAQAAGLRALGELPRQLHEVTVEVTQCVTVMRRFISQQEAVNNRTEHLLDAMEQRIRAAESWQSAMAARMPSKLMDADVIERRISAVEGTVQAVAAKVDSIERMLAKWTGIAVAAWAIIQLVGQPLLQWLKTLVIGS